MKQLPDSFILVNVASGIRSTMTRVSPWRFHASWEAAKGHKVENFYDEEELVNWIADENQYLVAAEKPLDGPLALRSRTTAEYLDFACKGGASERACGAMARVIVLLNKVMYGHKRA